MTQNSHGHLKTTPTVSHSTYQSPPPHSLMKTINRVRDVTRKVKRYAGPKGDFHGSDVKLSDLLFYDEDVLAEKYPKIQITNALGVKKVVSTLTGTTMNLRSP
jgi:hypothetical protein